MSVVANKGARFNYATIENYQSVAEIQHNLMSKYVHLKDLYDVDPFNIIRVDGGK